ncbi:hypothetical protein M8C21_001530 [Ambrosia artemisiifolia]|uniref:hydroxymethylglutaryl-CoA reductase (NADPH) n=1 Tax=Ambrosia artemisiifolia TaxID=4212 RepID=A0AAD5GGM5_AMBAR|nr:hypothetical protein M8C21_001530 [Ambrosia artemisiifolia]
MALPHHPNNKNHNIHNNNNNNNASPFPLPLFLTNGIFLTLFFSVSYFLLLRCPHKLQSPIPLHAVTLTQLFSIILLVSSFIYLLNFFSIGFVQSFIATSRPYHDTLQHDVLPKPKLMDNNNNNSFTCENDVVLDNNNKPNGFIISEEDEEIINSVVNGTVSSYSLEEMVGDCRRAAAIRREAVERKTGRSVLGLPFIGFDYESILGQCCEMPIGYVQIPVGIAGPLLLNGGEYMVPMATTEGCLVASTNRGCKAVFSSGGATAVLLKDGMTRAPVVRFGTVARAATVKFFLEDRVNFETLSIVFNKSSRFARLQSIQCSIAGRNLYIRFSCSTGDAMGMNMVSKGVQNVLDFLHIEFPDMDVIGISGEPLNPFNLYFQGLEFGIGNFCSDKKPSAVNWIEGRGKSVVCESVITEEVVRKVLKTTVPALVELNMLKNLAGSAIAGSLGGFNAHAANIVSAIFIATGQDPAQNIESSHCITMMEAVNGGKDLHISVTMPAIEVGTVGGGTQLASQAACLNLLGVKGASKESPGSNARLLATIVAGSVLAGELSLMSAISAGQLVKSHMKYNRSNQDITAMIS